MSTREASGEHSHSRLSSTVPCFDHFHCTFLLQEKRKHTVWAFLHLKAKGELKAGGGVVGKAVQGTALVTEGLASPTVDASFRSTAFVFPPLSCFSCYTYSNT